ncbi:MAG: hypothetical protein SOV61_00260 [Lachnospiraceae bacterium]|nr:hypothetical protein [Lachnospiraceae bacterium]
MAREKSVTIREIATGKEFFFESRRKLAKYLMIDPATVSAFLRGESVMNRIFVPIELDEEPYEVPRKDPVYKGRQKIKYFDSVTIRDKVTNEITTCYDSKELMIAMRCSHIEAMRRFLNGDNRGRLHHWYELLEMKVTEDCHPLDYSPYTRRKKSEMSQ